MKIRSFSLVLLLLSLGLSAQFSKMIRTLERLEQRRGLLEAPINADISQRKFILIKDQPENINRQTLVFSETSATLADVSERKGTPEMESHVYQGDFVKTKKNVLSLRFSFMDGRPTALPLTKILIISQQDHMLYLFDPVTKERWLDAEALKNYSTKKSRK